MAQDRIEDYAFAKRKAARQAGFPDTRQLPDNEEIDAELRRYRELFQQEQPGLVRELRELALSVMEKLEEFDPYLTGSVLRGSAGDQAVIQLMLFTENAKAVEFFLLNENIGFDCEQSKYFAGDQVVDAPVLAFDHEGVPIKLALLSPFDKRSILRKSPTGKPIERASRRTLAEMLEDYPAKR